MAQSAVDGAARGKVTDGRNDLSVSEEGYQTDPPVLHADDYDYNARVTLNGDTRFDIQLVRR